MTTLGLVLTVLVQRSKVKGLGFSCNDCRCSVQRSEAQGFNEECTKEVHSSTGVNVKQCRGQMVDKGVKPL